MLTVAASDRRVRSVTHDGFALSGPGDETEGELLEVGDGRLPVEWRERRRSLEDGREQVNERALERSRK